jgi:Protein of unknown function (DUF1444)
MSTATPADFQALLVARLRETGWSVEELGPLELRVTGPAGKGEGVFNLGNMHRQFLNGALIGDIAGVLTQTLQEAGDVAPIAAELDLARLMPLLKTRELLSEALRTNVEPIAWQPFITADLIITLVFDFPQSVRYVRASEVAASGKDFDDLLEIGLANLYARTQGEMYEVGDEQTGRLFILATQDGYDATRILLGPLLERLAGRVSGELVIGIPNRDFFIAFGNANPLLVGQVGQQIKCVAQARNYPLTETLFTFRNGALEVYGAQA